MACIKDPLKEDMIKLVSEFEKDAKVRAFGYGDPSTGEWLWNKYVGHPRDPKRCLMLHHSDNVILKRHQLSLMR